MRRSIRPQSFSCLVAGRHAIRAAVLSFAIFAATGGGAEAVSKRPGVDELLKRFETVVFGAEFKGVKEAVLIRKWNQTIYYTVESYTDKVIKKPGGNEVRELRRQRLKKRYGEFISDHLGVIGEMTGLTFKEAGPAKRKPNFAIKFAPEQQMDNPYLVSTSVNRNLLRSLAYQRGCYFLSWVDDKTFEYNKTIIVVNTNLKLPRIRHCLLEEILQSLGMPNDIKAQTDSIFSNLGFHQTDGLTRADQILVRTLYHPALRIGMSREEAMFVARRVITELDKKLP